MFAKAILFTLLVSTLTLGQSNPSPAPAGHVPTIDELLTIETAGGAQISPDGKWVAYTISGTDFKTDDPPIANLAGQRRQRRALPVDERRQVCHLASLVARWAMAGLPQQPHR
jgi:hypothetical protein